MEKDLIGPVRWIGGALLAAQLAACGGKAVGCPSDAVDCSDDSGDSGAGGAPAQTASTGLGGSTGLGNTGQGGTGLGSAGQGSPAPNGSTRPGTSSSPPTSTSSGSGGSFGSGTTGEGNVAPTGFAGTAGSSAGANSGTRSGSTSGAAGFSGAGGTTSSVPQTAPPCPAVQPASVRPRAACVAATPLSASGPSCTETWCNRPTVPSVVSCEAVQATVGDAYHYTLNGDSYDATFSFDLDRAQSGQYPEQSTFLSVRFALDVGVTNQGTPIVDRIEVPAALALARGLSFVDHTIVGTLALRAGELNQDPFEQPIYHSGCSPVLDRSGLPAPGPCACGFEFISLNIPVYAPLSRIP